MKWDEYYIKLAMLVATKSKDPSTKVGCVIVGPDNEIRSTGFNGFPRGVQETQEGSQHLPGDIELSEAHTEYEVSCSCGDVINVPRNAVMENVNGVWPVGCSYRALLKELIVVTGHFVEQSRVLHEERWERPEKYEWIEHAERNAVYNAARVGVSLNGCTAYLNWEPRPCIPCARAFIQAGISEVVGPDIAFSSNKDWKFDKSVIMLQEAGVGVREVPWAAE